MDWTTILTGIGTVMGVWLAVYSVIRNFKVDINKHIDRLDLNMTDQGKRIDNLYSVFTETVKSQNERTDNLYSIFTETVKSQNLRTDHLYEICIDMLKEGKK